MKLLKLALPFAVVSGLALSSAPAFAWDMLGIRTVHRGVDHDTIRVYGNDKHKQFRMCVRFAGVQVRDIDIRFANGGRQDVAVRRFFAPGTCTRVVDLKGNKRNIRRIDVTYRRINSNRFPIVTFWAR
jgi:hypothetical protein